MEKTYTLKSGRAVRLTANNKRESLKWGDRHFAYTATISVDGKNYKTTFHDSVANFRQGISYPKGMPDSILESILLDALCYEEHQDLVDFLTSYCYPDGDREGIECWEGCREASEHLGRILSEEEIEELREIVEL